MAAEMVVLEGQQTQSPANEEANINLVRYTNQCQCCGKCGHVLSACHHQSSLCYKCGKRGHLQAVCRSKLTTAPDKALKQVIRNSDSSPLNQLLKCEDTNDTDDLKLLTITGGVTQDYYVHLKVNRKQELDKWQCQ